MPQLLIAFAAMTEGKPLPVRISADQVKRIDKLRGMVARERYVRHLLERALKAEERRKAAKR